MGKMKSTSMEVTCKICDKVLPNSKSLSLHSKLHTSERPFICNLCSHTFKTKKYLNAHKRKVHRAATKHACEFCGRKFHFKSLLQKHIYKHTNERPYKCEDCGKGFNSKYTLSTHRYIHAGTKPFECKFCDYACRDSSTLRKHQERHMGITRLYECKVCQKSYKTKKVLKVHVAMAHLDIDMKNFGCSVCGNMFSTRTRLNSHIKIVHERLNSCECDICGMKISSKYNMMTHLTKHIDIKPFQCEFKGCTKRYKDKWTLKKHSVVHFPEKQHVCDVCQKRFTRKERLRRHKIQHQLKRKSVMCDYCGKRFYNKNYIRSHILRKHIIQQQYICDLCGLLTYNKPSIVMHLKYGHVSEADRQCKICKKRYKRHIYLKAHYWKTHCIKYKMTRRQPKPKKTNLKLIAEEPTDVKDIALLHEIKVEALSDAELEGKGTEYSNGVLSEDITRAMTEQNKESIPERNFENFFIQHIIRPSASNNSIENDNDNAFDTQRRVKKFDRDTLEEWRQARQMKDLEQVKQDDRHMSVDLDNVKHEKIEIPYTRPTEEIEVTNTNINNEVTTNNSNNKSLDDELTTAENNNHSEKSTDLHESVIMSAENGEVNNSEQQNTNDRPDEIIESLQANHNMDLVCKSQHLFRNDDLADFDINTQLTRNSPSEHNYLENEVAPIDTGQNNETINNIQREMRLNELIDEQISTHVYHKTINNNTLDTEKRNDGQDKVRERQSKNGRRLSNVNKTIKNCIKITQKSLKNDNIIVNENVTNVNNNIKEILMETDMPRTRGRISILKRTLKEKDETASEDGDTDDDYQPDDETDKNKNASKKFKINTHQCYVCFQLYETKEKLLDHCKQHFDICNTKMLKKCPLCDYVTNCDLRRHVRLIHKLNINILYGTLKDRKNNNNKSRFYLNVDNSTINEIEVIPSIKNLNRQAFLKIDRQRRENNDKVLKKTKLVKKDGEWIVEKETINTKAENYVLPEVVDKEDLLKVGSDDYFGKMRRLSKVAKKNGQKMLFPCDKCSKICQTLSALKLHCRRHDPNPKPFKKKVWKHKLKENIELEKSSEKPKATVSENRYAKPKPIVNKHKCDPKLKAFYENNIKGGDIEFWHFLKIFNKMSRENVNDFSDLENRTEFGMHCYNQPENNESIDVPKESEVKKRVVRNVKKLRNGVFKRTIMIGKRQHENRKAIMEALRQKAMESQYT